MRNWTDIIEVSVTAVLISYLMTPIVKKIALKTGYLDHPKDIKVHARPTPLLGGVSIYIAFVVSLFATLNFTHGAKFYGIIVGSTFLLIIGLIDDKMGMMPEMKLLAQFLAAMIVIKSGVQIEFLPNHYLNVALSYLWIMGITNAFNLLDNMNGLSAGIAVIAAAFFGVVMWSSNQLEIAIISFAMAGAALGFLRHNFPVADIFMGDSGSLVIGFVLASTALVGSWSTTFPTTSLAMPIVILAYPIFDTTLVTVMRLRERRSVFQGGKDHSSHRLSLLGFKRRGAVLVIYGICVLLGVSALLIQRLPLVFAMILCAFIVILMIAFGIRLSFVDTKSFGRKKGANGITQ